MALQVTGLDLGALSNTLRAESRPVLEEELEQGTSRQETKEAYVNNGMENNGWSKEVEEEMKGILRVLKVKDEEQYVRLGKLVLNINKTLAISGPLFAGLAATGAGLLGSPVAGPLPALLGVVGGALAAVVNTLEHGGQVGMVFELFRNCGGFYRRLQEEIECNLGEREVEKRENGGLFQMKIALQLGRSLSELKGFAMHASPSCRDEDALHLPPAPSAAADPAPAPSAAENRGREREGGGNVGPGIRGAAGPPDPTRPPADEAHSPLPLHHRHRPVRHHRHRQIPYLRAGL